MTSRKSKQTVNVAWMIFTGAAIGLAAEPQPRMITSRFSIEGTNASVVLDTAKVLGLSDPVLALRSGTIEMLDRAISDTKHLVQPVECTVIPGRDVAIDLKEVLQSNVEPWRSDSPEPQTRDDFIVIDEMPRMLSCVNPEYPEVAVLTSREATVWVKALIGVDGIVCDARIAKSSGVDLGFDEATLECAYKNTYSPAKRDGEPIAIWITYPVSFTLSDGENHSAYTREKRKPARGINLTPLIKALLLIND